jgi:hypothetical protein
MQEKKMIYLIYRLLSIYMNLKPAFYEKNY